MLLDTPHFGKSRRVVARCILGEFVWLADAMRQVAHCVLRGSLALCGGCLGWLEVLHFSFVFSVSVVVVVVNIDVLFATFNLIKSIRYFPSGVRYGTSINAHSVAPQFQMFLWGGMLHHWWSASKRTALRCSFNCNFR